MIRILLQTACNSPDPLLPEHASVPGWAQSAYLGSQFSFFLPQGRNNLGSLHLLIWVEALLQEARSGVLYKGTCCFLCFSQQQTPPKEPPVLLVGQSVMSPLRSHDQTLGPALEKGRFSNLAQKP